MQIAFVHVALNISNLDPRLHIYVLVWVALHISSIVTELTLYFALFSAPVRHLTPPTPPMWWSRARVSAPTSPRASLCPRVPLTSLGSPLMTRTATWSLEAGHTMALRSETIWSGKFYTFYISTIDSFVFSAVGFPVGCRRWRYSILYPQWRMGTHGWVGPYDKWNEIWNIDVL